MREGTWRAARQLLFMKTGFDMKKHFFFLTLTVLLLTAACALAAPELTNIMADDSELISGQDGWYFDFETTEGGTLAMRLYSGDTGEFVCELGTAQVEEGTGRIRWDGMKADDTAVPEGNYMLMVQLRNYWGEESEQQLLSLHIYDSEESAQANTLDLSLLDDAQEVQSWDEPQTEQTAVAAAEDGKKPVPQATSFWDMDPDAYDLTDPDHQQAIWDLMMQPITVMDVGQTEHVYPTNTPGGDRKPYEQNCAGELHGQSQGVHVLEEDTDGDGYVLIEAYSNDGTKTDNEYMESLNAKKIQGYVKKSILFETTPSSKYALLVDKLRQKMYIFEAGAIIGELDVSTGLNNAKQPYNESPAGEYITVSKVGDFNAGGGTIGRFAIRINGGTLLHEVLHDTAADGTRIYTQYEAQLGMKASHGCIRIQRRANAQGQNMQWLWNNLENRTKVFIWDDQGRQMYEPELPDSGLQLYRNPNGGSNYHIDENCSGVKSKFLPLTGDFTYGDLEKDEFKKLTPCASCGAPARPETLYERYVFEAEQIGAEVTEDVKAKFGIQ